MIDWILNNIFKVAGIVALIGAIIGLFIGKSAKDKATAATFSGLMGGASAIVILGYILLGLLPLYFLYLILKWLFE